MMIRDSQLAPEKRAWRADAGHLRTVDVIRLPKRGWYLPLKTMGETVACAALLILFAPVIALSALLVKLTSRGPAFYSQIRLGKDGRPFAIYKIRTMTHECEKESGPQWCAVHDPRVTRLGRLLRRTHIDEFPQLWNVIRGDMALIGPRPERPEIVPQLERALPHYGHRLLVKPGVSGLAQVQLAADTDIASVRRKLAYDLFYIRHMNPWMDLRIVLCTAFHMAGVPYHVLRSVFRFPCGNTVEHAAHPPSRDLPPLAHVQSA
jgi:lipopolysaccharide/colanic/teichoic acid biosynthesis glycosyltransferase